MPAPADTAAGLSVPGQASAWIDGRPARADELRVLALSNYGHFTSMQVRGRAVRGWGLHLQRLHAGSLALFGVGTGPEPVCHALRSALEAAGLQDASVRITVFARDFDLRWPERAQDLCLLVTVSAPRDVATAALRVATRPFARVPPQLKHAGLCPSFALTRDVRQAGFDDVLFVDGAGRLSEGATWNIGFWDGDSVVWPQADALRGTTEQLLQAGLERQGVPQRLSDVRVEDLVGFQGAFATHAVGVRGIRAIDGLQYDEATVAARARRLHAIFCEHPPQPI